MKKTNCEMVLKMAFVLIAFLTSFSCSSSSLEEKALASQEGKTLVSPKYNRNTPLRNPLSGWVMYAGRTAMPSFWDQEYYVPDLGKKVKAIDYAAAGYIRTSWSSLNPSDGVYAWRDPSSQIGQLIQGALDRGLPIALRIVIDGRDQGLNTPQFVFDAGAQYYLENSNFPTRRTPYPQDPVFRQYYTKFIEALAEDFNDPDKTSFIDAYGFGKWGEAHNVIYEDPNTSTGANTEVLKEEVLDWVTDLYTRTFTQVPLVINYHRLIGHPASWGNANPNSDRLLVKAINKGYSLRQDAFGMTEYYQGWEKQFAKTWNYKRPILMEGGWITSGTHRYWIDPSGNYREGHPEDVRQGEFDAAKEAHVNMMDFRAGDTDSWFEKTFNLVQSFISEGGYRLYPDQIYLPATLEKGQQTTISHRWRNMGWGYFPNNIPQWNYKYKVAFALLNEQGQPQQVFIDEEAEPSNWLKDQASVHELNATVDLPAGTYSWAVAIIDSSKENQPGIELAVNGEVTDSGWLKLLELTIN
ncbi:DUF4832 domain-containing protein [Sphingobacterium bambusae]|uniref:DUF4832 domain-containing protein n=1 Tax=Sphingobacterium bambusae TaxID=662858 RepID=A0ABW6BA33_9SPHI|nr:DUF4832 domain-containing protein [Sphingobacterium bambusae]WPL49176.1 DUF4832 domain-containing protein [Sphingobacterium bambusae]